jgi:hypothetical protein
MSPKKLVLKLAVLMLSLATLHASQTAAPEAFLCTPFARLCSTGRSAGHCGFQAFEDCNTCYGNDGSTLGGGCPRQ